MKFLYFCMFLKSSSCFSIPYKVHALSSCPKINMRYERDCYECYCNWEVVNDTKFIVMDKYFGQHIEKNQKCEVFCIEGVPAASMIYTNQNKNKNPIVDAFYTNKAMLLLFDGGSHMREKLLKKYKHIDIQHAKNDKV